MGDNQCGDEAKPLGRIRIGVEDARALLALCEAAGSARVVVEMRSAHSGQKGGLYAYVAQEGRNGSVLLSADAGDRELDAIEHGGDERTLLSQLVASGLVETSADAQAWVARAAVAIRRVLPQPASVLIWSYRQGPNAAQCVSAKFAAPDGAAVEAVLRADGWHDDGVLEATAPDMAEALHMVGLLIAELSVADVVVGRREG